LPLAVHGESLFKFRRGERPSGVPGKMDGESWVGRTAAIKKHNRGGGNSKGDAFVSVVSSHETDGPSP